ncbi:AAA family ATPase [Desulfurivibrio sp. D14AmB]|uniref:ExeA family protein n=1 Tax=Desulfurivibrio sp. D14AmB TaxID=3374370 RepID=UPI00376F160B
MYENYFGFHHKPFAITPDPRALYLSERHREALAHLLYGVGEGGGFVLLTGEVGTGKTTLCRSLLEQLPADVDLALILNPKLDAVELVAAICDELKISYPAGRPSLKVLVAALNDYLLQNHAAGRRTVLIIDEAQNLAPEVLEQVRLLTNLETAEIKLLQIILIGQPELRELLKRDELRQLAQRITARYHLDPLDRGESTAYVRHRLQVAGVERPLFSAGALKALYRLSGGVPRLINVIADRALLGAYVEERNLVDEAILRRAAGEVLAAPTGPAPSGRRRFELGRPWALVLLLLLLLPVALWLGQRFGPDLPHFIPEKWLGMMAPRAGENESPLAAVLATEEGNEGESRATIDLAAGLANLDDDDEVAAWTALFALWGEEGADGAGGCLQAQTLGLRCLEGSGSWALLRLYNRPALLRLTNAVDQPGRTILLVGLNGQEAVIAVAGEEWRLPLAELEPYWLGDYRLLWRPPLRGELLRAGNRGADVLRLRAVLDRLEQGAEAESPLPMAADPTYFDDELARRVAAFQREHGLQPDGIVGLQTQLRLSFELEEPGTPRLVVAPAGP